MIERIFERLDDIDATKVLATTDDDYNQQLIDCAKKYERNWFAYTGDINDLMGRIQAVVEHYSPQFLVYICGDCPLVDPDFILKALDELKSNPQADTIDVLPDDAGNKTLHEGILCTSIAGWQKLYAASNSALEREHVGLANRGNRLLSTVSIRERNFTYQSQQRISVDTVADWQFMNQLYKRWYNNNQSPVPLKWAVKQFINSPDLTKLNSHVQQKYGLKKYGKAIFVTQAGKSHGLGQLKRTQRIAERYSEETGLGVELLILGDELPEVTPATLNCRWVNHLSDIQRIISNTQEVQSILLDLFYPRFEIAEKQRLEEMLKQFKSNGIALFGLDHMAHCHKYLDLVFVPAGFYDGPTAENIKTGVQYMILPKWELESLSNTNAPSLVVFTGGSDALHYGDWLPEKLSQWLPRRTKVKWIQGPFAPPPKLPQGNELVWETVFSPKDISQHIKQNDIALSVYGTTLFELIANKVEVWALPAPSLVSESEWLWFCGSNMSKYIDEPQNSENTFSSIFHNNEKTYSNKIHQPDSQGASRIVTELVAKIKSIA